MAEAVAIMYLGIVVLAAKLGGEVAQRLRAPTVLGEILTGVLIGPMLGVIDIANDAYHFLSYISSLALLFLLFRIGMDSNLRAMVAYGRKAFFIASAGVLLSASLAILWAISGIGLGPGAVRDPLILGLILMSTSVVIPTRIIQEMGKLDLLESTMILESSMIDDILTLLALSLVLGSLDGGMSLFAIAAMSLRIMLFIAIFVAVSRRAVPIAISLTQRMKTPDAELIVVLSLACFAAVAAEAAGLAFIAGAFLLGLVLSDMPDRVVIESRMEAMCNLFIPVFFVLVGVNLPLKDPRTLLLVGSIATVLAVAGKLAGCGLMARWYGFSPLQSLRIGVGMVPRAEVALVVSTVALSEGLISSTVFGMAVLLTISTAFISIVLTAVVFSGEDRIIDLSERELVEPEPLDGVRIRSISVRTAEDVLGLSREPAGRDILLMRVSGELEHAVEAAARRLKGTHHLKRLDSGLYMLRPQCIAAHD